jgi:signal transduction histidine kinase
MGGSFADRVSLEHGSDCLRAIGDPPRVRQILRNLLTNAERYGGDDVSVVLRRRGRNVEIDVTDDGPGIARTDWERVFEPYQTAHQSPGRPGSVGIGLAISRQLAELMGGGLDYRYEGGRSVFRLWLVAADR